jgi:membrane protein CcdC involved in cytochrome C biogenesis
LIVYPDSNLFSNQSFLFVIIIIVLLQLRERRVNKWRMMILPAFMLLITASLVQSVIFSNLLNFVIISVGLGLGILVGIAVGSFMEVKIDEYGTMILKGSLAAVGLWISVILLKIYGQGVLNNTRYFNIGVLSSAILMLTLGAMISRRIMVYNKYRNFKKMSENKIQSTI